MKPSTWVLCAAAVLAAGLAAPAQDSDPARTQQIRKLVAEHDRLEAMEAELANRNQGKLAKAAAAVMQTPELAGLDQQRQRLRAAFYRKYETDTKVLGARAAAGQAKQALQAAMAEALPRLPQVQAAQAEHDAAAKAYAELKARIQQSTEGIAAVRKGLWAHPQVLVILQARNNAEQSLRELERADPQIVAARRTRDQAKRAYEEALQRWIASSPEHRAMQAAARAYAETLRTHSGLVLARTAIEAAEKQAEQAVEQLLAFDAAAAAHEGDIKQLAEQREALRARRDAAQAKLSQAWKAAAETDPALSRLAERSDEAANLAEQARAELYAGPERKAYEKARDGLTLKAAEAVRAAPELAGYYQELEALQAERSKVAAALAKLGVTAYGYAKYR